jgi:two-component system KDP operon response regulator KdpE
MGKGQNLDFRYQFGDSTMTKILLIDDGAVQLGKLQPALESDGYHVFKASDGQTSLKIAWSESPDLVILNLKLPAMSGFETCRRLRELGIPFVLVTSPTHREQDVIKALEMGADDYLRYPLEVPILLAKLRTLLRRNHRQVTSAAVYDDGHLCIDLDSRKVTVGDELIKLTPTEFRLLSILLRQVGRVVTHEELIKEIWGTEKNTSLGSLKLYIHYLRQKLEESPKKPYYLLAEWGVGYRFRELQTEPA